MKRMRLGARADRPEGFPAPQVPELDPAGKVGRRQRHPVGREGDPANGRLAEPEGQELLPGRDVPELDSPGIIARGDTCPLRREGQALQLERLDVDPAQRPALGQAPDPDPLDHTPRRVVVDAADTRHETAVGREGEGTHHAFALSPPAVFSTRLIVPTGWPLAGSQRRTRPSLCADMAVLPSGV